VEILSRVPEGIIGVRKENRMALAFHPELSTDLRLHAMFLETLGIN
jgi:5'-phosphate synthase pdxT subunit